MSKEKEMSDNIAQRIEASLSLSVCNGWDRGFLESVMSQVSRGRKLSVRQKEMLEQVLSRNTEEQQKVHEGWAQTYQDQYSDSGRILATYYSRTSYYRDMSACILNGEVPERKSFLRMFENKYAQKVLSEHAATPKFERGALVTARSNFDNATADFGDTPHNRLQYPTRRSVLTNFRQRGAFILDVDDNIYSSAKGAKRYKVLPIGSVHPFFVEERHIKIKRK
jgi:hypothetical protein